MIILVGRVYRSSSCSRDLIMTGATFITEREGRWERGFEETMVILVEDRA